jgi:hypothetical protein
MTRTAAVLVLGLLAAPALAQETHLLVITGIGGDEEHTARFHEWATTIVRAATERGGIADSEITLLSGRPEPLPAGVAARSTRDNVRQAFADLAARARPDDVAAVVLIGHGSFDGRVAAFNLPGPDLTADDYALLLAPVGARRIVFVNTTSSSGGFLEPLRGPGRVVVTATRTAGERNETLFPEFFAEAFADNTADTDRNGRVSLGEAFEYARSKVTAAYQKEGIILTEHATLDDGQEGKVAGTLFLASERAREAATASIADPELRALVEDRRRLEDRITELRLRKDSMDPAQYEQQLEALLTELALKSRAIREREAKP